MFDISRIVQVFQDEEHPETIAAGFVNEEGSDLLFSVHDPETILDMAQRLAMFADEIQTNRAHNTHSVIAQLDALGPGATIGDLAKHQQRLREAGVVTLDSKRGE